MCGRYYIDVDEEELRQICKEIEEQQAIRVKTGEIFPSDIAPVLTGRGGNITPRGMVWGFPRWDSKGVIFNARSETVTLKSMFRRALLNHPAVIPATGFYEWKKITGSSKKEKYFFREPNDNIVYFAGFYNTFAEKDGPVPERFNILTTDANCSMKPYHNRMPVLLRKDEREAWLSGEQLNFFLERTPFDVVAESV